MSKATTRKTCIQRHIVMITLATLKTYYEWYSNIEMLMVVARMVTIMMMTVMAMIT